MKIQTKFLSDLAPNAEELSALRQDHDRFRLLVENTLDLVVEISPTGEFLYVSPNAHAALGYHVAELLGTNVFARVHPDDLAHVQAQFEKTECVTTCRYQHRNGAWHWLEVAGRDFVTPDGEARAVLIVRDITARKIADAEHQQLAELGQLAQNVSHDFNNLLAVIIGCTELALLDVGHLPEAVKLLMQVKKAGERARQLMQPIRAFGQQQLHDTEFRTRAELASATTQHTSGTGEHLLLVNGDPVACAAQHALLQQLCYRVTVETNPLRALEIFSDRPEEFKLLVVAAALPQMTGSEFIAIARAIRPQVPACLTATPAPGFTAQQLRELLPAPAPKVSQP